MRLKYRILWFEDNDDYMNEVIIPEVSRHLLEDLGLELDLVWERNGSNLESLLREGESYDLIVTDLNLENGDAGNVIIEKIRFDQILTEVLLYSSDGKAVEGVKNEAHGIERVSFAVGRDVLPEKLQRIIDITVRKVQDVHNMRGLVIAEAIDLEDQMLDIITSHFGVCQDEAVKTGFIQYHVEKATERSGRHLSKISAYTPEKILEFVDVACHEMMGKYIALNKLIDIAKTAINGTTAEGLEKLKALEGLEAELKKMNDDVINLRNDLAHVRGEKDAQGNWILKNKKQERETVFDNAKYVEIRRNLRSHANNLAEIAKHIP